MNKIIKYNLKSKLGNLKTTWVDELPKLLWVYHTTKKNMAREKLFILAFSTEVMILIKLKMSNARVLPFQEESNMLSKELS